MIASRTRPTSKASHPGDTELLARIAAGDLAALGALYDAHGAAVLRLASQLAGSTEADDVAHDTFLRATQIAARFDPQAESARPWLFGITARVVQERRRSLRRFLDAVSRFGAHRERTVASPKDEDSDVARALAELSTPKRTVLVLSEVEGFSCQEIADMLAIPIGTVWTRLHHARKEFRAAWERDQ